MANWYCSSVAHAAVAQFATTTAYSVGQIVRQLAAPTVGNERCFRCTTAGTSGGAEAAWNLTKGATTSQGTAVFTEVTGNETYQGTSWAAPFARLVAANSASWIAAGDTVFVSADHAETQTTSMTISGPGTVTNPVRVICVARPSSAIPPVAVDQTTGATVTTTTTGEITTSHSIYVYGVGFSCGSGASGSLTLNLDSGQNFTMLENCSLTLGSTTGTSRIITGTASASTSSGAVTILKNTNIVFGATTNSFLATHRLLWDGGTLSGTAPTTLFLGAVTANIDVRNVDLSTLAGSSTLVTLGTTAPGVTYNFTNCKLNASLSAVISGSVGSFQDGGVDLVISDSSTNTSREEHYQYAGSVIADTTNYLTNGASDGTTHKSWKMVANSSAKYFHPLLAPDIFQWVGSTGSHTFTLFLSTLTGSLLDTEFGFDIEYMGSALTPKGTFDSSMAAITSSGTALSSDTQAWSGQSGITKMKVTKTVTLNRIGWVRITPRLVKASQTVWVDPLVVVS